MKKYCKQKNGNCLICEKAQGTLDCERKVIRRGTRKSRILAAYDGHRGTVTMKRIRTIIGNELYSRLTGTEYGMVMSAVNRAFNEGKASCGAEIIDENAVWVDSIQKIIEWEEVGAEYELETEGINNTSVTCHKKVKPGEIVTRILE